ncbi:MAG TPA: three-Cys-motif partner protein TcmP [Candidatus Eisenbacteria bacterium]
MTAPRTTVWEIDAHTPAKHNVLREYLKAWFPIMSRVGLRLVFVDGFAGPGVYSKGEPGSPVIAMETYRESYLYLAPNFRSTGNVVFLFVEKDQDRVASLKELIQRAPKLPGKVEVDVVTGDFATAMQNVLATIPTGRRMAPAFVMVDPFGVKDYPLDVLTKLLGGGKVELYISFMYEWIDRFKSTEEFAAILTPLYGTDEWRKALDLTGDAKRDFLLGLYENQLRKAGAKHVLRFDLHRKGRNVYSLFFATQHEKGSDVMKKAMWNVAPFGDFAFHGRRDPQLAFGAPPPDVTPLRDALLAEFNGKWTTIEDVAAFVSSDRTDFHTGHLKKPLLIPMERAGRIEVDPKSRKATWGFPDGTRFRFR